MIYDILEAFRSMKSTETARSYLSIAKEWSSFLGVEYGPKCSNEWISADRSDVLGYIKFLQKKPGQASRYDPTHWNQANATIRKKLVVLRTFYQLLMDEREIDHNPWRTGLITPPNAERRMKRKTEALSVKDVRKLLALPDTRKRAGVRDMALLSICLGAGLRINEALKLTTKDILIDDSSANWSLRLREPKSGPDQEQPLPDWAQESLSVLVAQRRSDSDRGENLFCRYNAKEQAYKPLIYRTAARIFKRYFLQAGLINKSTHSLRKSAINKIAASGEPLIFVRDFARHKSVTSTEKYWDEVRNFVEPRKVSY